MDYATATRLYFRPPPADAPTPPSVADAGPARRLRDAVEPLGAHGIWARETNERYAALGLNFLTGYVRGRAASLGEPTTDVVVATFGVFSRSLLAPLYEETLATVSRGEVLEARVAGTIASLERILGEEDVTRLVDVLVPALDGADGVARPLFSGLRGLGWPGATLGALWRACELLREHRGDGHLAVCVSAGLDPVEMNILTELYSGMPLGSYTASRGWTPEEIEGAVGALTDEGMVRDGALTDEGVEFRVEVERQTDDLEQPILDELGDDLEWVIGEIGRLSERIIAGEGFPPDPWKRAAG